VTCRSVAAGPHSSPRRCGLRESGGCRRASFARARLCETPAGVAEQSSRIFVTHAWENSDDYLRVFEYLESQRNFFYRNYSTLTGAAGDKEALRENLRQQITPAEAIIALSSSTSASGSAALPVAVRQASHKP